MAAATSTAPTSTQAPSVMPTQPRDLVPHSDPYAGGVRVVVLGAGGIGGTIGARLHQAGCDVALIARGAHGEAIREHGLTFETPEERVTLRIPAYAHPRDLTWRDDDVVVVAAKSQDTEAAARDLYAVAGKVPVVAAQNGVANERTLARWFGHVHGLCVMMPTAHLEPGVVQAHSVAATGILDLGRFPDGMDEIDEELAATLRASRFESEPRPDIMRWKYRKLVNNLGNAVQALCGRRLDSADARTALDLLTAEADAVFASAGIDPVTDQEDDVRRADHLQLRPIGEQPRAGGSTWQSLTRGSGIETDFLNGEIALLGRLHGVPTPANERIQALMADAATRHVAPGSMSISELLEGLTR
jgi:2-dehydropantoate 2-reductase